MKLRLMSLIFGQNLFIITSKHVQDTGYDPGIEFVPPCTG